MTVRTGLAEEFGVPMYFLCTEFDGQPSCDDHSEMVAPQMSDLGEILKAIDANSKSLFAPFADSIRVLNDVLYQEVNYRKESDELSETVLPTGKDADIIITRKDFNESDHPRDGNGKFTDGGGGSTSVKSQPKRVASKKGEKPSEAFAKKCLSAFTGLKTSDGKSVEQVHDHAMFKMESRGIRPSSAVRAITKGKATAGNKPNRTVYEYNGTHVVYDDKSKMITTCIYKGKGKKGAK